MPSKANVGCTEAEVEPFDQELIMFCFIIDITGKIPSDMKEHVKQGYSLNYTSLKTLNTLPIDEHLQRPKSECEHSYVTGNVSAGVTEMCALHL